MKWWVSEFVAMALQEVCASNVFSVMKPTRMPANTEIIFGVKLHLDPWLSASEALGPEADIPRSEGIRSGP